MKPNGNHALAEAEQAAASEAPPPEPSAEPTPPELVLFSEAWLDANIGNAEAYAQQLFAQYQQTLGGLDVLRKQRVLLLSQQAAAAPTP